MYPAWVHMMAKVSGYIKIPSRAVAEIATRKHRNEPVKRTPKALKKPLEEPETLGWSVIQQLDSAVLPCVRGTV